MRIMGSTREQDEVVVAAINGRASISLRVTGRARHGNLGGAIFAEWADGRPAVVTRFLGSLAEAERTAEVLSYARARGAPVPRHELVVDLGDRVMFVQERLPSMPDRLTPARVEAIVEINDRFAGALADRPDVPVCPLYLDPGDDPRYEILAKYSPRSRRIRDAIVEIADHKSPTAPDTDLLHVDLSAANVLFDENDAAVAVVDWNLGVCRGDRLFALVKTRFDREWFVRAPDADPVENAAATHLDEILAARISADVLRRYWAAWLLYQLHRALPGESTAVIDWHLDLAEARLR